LKSRAIAGTTESARRLSPHGESGLKFNRASEEDFYEASLSAWREWIEISCTATNWCSSARLSPHGESGLKCPLDCIWYVYVRFTSLSAWREWIEMQTPSAQSPSRSGCLSPHGESGLKFYSRRHSRRFPSLSPHGESGLKFGGMSGRGFGQVVSLRMERVD